MPPDQSNLPEGVEAVTFSYCVKCGEWHHAPNVQGGKCLIPGSRARYTDHERVQVEVVKRSDLPAIKEQARQEERERWEGWLLSMLEFLLYLRTLREPPFVPRLLASIKRALQGKDAPKLGAHLGADAERQVRAALDQEGGGDAK